MLLLLRSILSYFESFESRLVPQEGHRMWGWNITLRQYQTAPQSEQATLARLKIRSKTVRGLRFPIPEQTGQVSIRERSETWL